METFLTSCWSCTPHAAYCKTESSTSGGFNSQTSLEKSKHFTWTHLQHSVLKATFIKHYLTLSVCYISHMKLYKNNEKPVKQGIRSNHEYDHQGYKITSLIFLFTIILIRTFSYRVLGSLPINTEYKILFKSIQNLEKSLISLGKVI